MPTPYVYDTYEQQNNPDAPRFTSPTFSDYQINQNGQQYAGRQQATYRDGQSNTQFVTQNYTPMGGSGGARNFAQNAALDMLMPGAGGFNIIDGMQQAKKARAQNRKQREAFDAARRNAVARDPTQWLNSLDPTSATAQQARIRLGRGDAMQAEEINNGLRQEFVDKQRKGYEGQIDAYFSDPSRAGWQQKVVQDRLQSDLGNITEQYGRNLTSSVQGSASAGLRGGSLDAERRGATARTRDSQALQASGEADASSAGFKMQDQQSRQQLYNLVNSDGGTNADTLNNALQGIQNATNLQGQQYSLGRQQRQQQQYAGQQQSQAWGQGLNGVAGAISTSQGGW